MPYIPINIFGKRINDISKSRKSMKKSTLIWLMILSVSCAGTKKNETILRLKPDMNTPVTIEKLMVNDSRVVRGFRGTPVDGTLESIEFRGFVSEYPDTLSDGFDASSGVDYWYNDNDGLHITFGDSDGFDTVIARGGARARLYKDTSSILEPGGGVLIGELMGEEDSESIVFGGTVQTQRVSFFGAEDGTLADIGFFRVHRDNNNREITKTWTVTGETVELPEMTSEYDVAPISYAMGKKYGDSVSSTVALSGGETTGTPIDISAGEYVHLIGSVLENGTGMDAVGIDMRIDGIPEGCDFTVVVNDPVDPQTDLMWLRFRAESSGRYNLVLDTPDQVFVDNNRLWLTMQFDKAVTLTGPDGGAPEIHFYGMSRGEALPEALAYRKFILKTQFALLSECRPWGSYGKINREEFFGSSQYAKLCPQMFLTIDACNLLDPEDDTARQYREWVYVRNLESLKEIEPPPEPPAGVPEWAWYPRMAWLEARRYAEWWLDNRIVPTGEFGGKVSDDSDLYQQFNDLPFFETGGVAAQLKDNAARLAELADKEFMKDGVNLLTCDALHAYEEGINHWALMSRWFYGNPIYFERCMESAKNVEKYTIVTDDGKRLFRDRHNLGHEDLATPREPDVDGHVTPLLWHTAFQVADYNHNPTALNVLTEWAETWLSYMKPGRWANEINVLTGEVTGFSPDRPLYGGYSTQAVTFTWLYNITGEAKFLEPFMHYYRQGQAPYPSDRSLGELYNLGLMDGLPSSTIDKLADRNPILKLYRTGDFSAMKQSIVGNERATSASIGNLYAALRFHDMYTTAEQFDDRLFLDIQRRPSECYLGGYVIRNKFNPTLAVSWEGFGTEYGALVTENSRNSLKALVYSYAGSSMHGKMKVWALEHGMYEVTTGMDTDSDNVMDKKYETETLELAKAGDIDIMLAPGTVTVIEIKQVEKLPPIYSRPDLAVAAREIDLSGTTIRGMVHNIGSADVSEVVVGIIDSEGNIVLKASVGALSAPLDLEPRRLGFTIELSRTPEPGWTLMIDPDNSIPEIYEGNNAVPLDNVPAVDYAKGWE
ncbi:hypothetical protein ACFL6H_02125 [Candidatus Latescibacterota bacterium]